MSDELTQEQINELCDDLCDGSWKEHIPKINTLREMALRASAVSEPPCEERESLTIDKEHGTRLVGPHGGLKKSMPSPTDADKSDPLFNAIWQVTKRWDVNAPEYYVGYCGMNGSHVMLILNALRESRPVGWPEGLRDPTAGDTYPPPVYSVMWRSGIHVKGHGNVLECYGETREIAEARRDAVLQAMRAAHTKERT